MLVVSPARSGEIIKLTHPLSHERYTKVLSFFFSYTLPYIDVILSTSESGNGYRPHTEMGIISYVH